MKRTRMQTSLNGVVLRFHVLQEPQSRQMQRSLRCGLRDSPGNGFIPADWAWLKILGGKSFEFNHVGAAVRRPKGEIAATSLMKPPTASSKTSRELEAATDESLRAQLFRPQAAEAVWSFADVDFCTFKTVTGSCGLRAFLALLLRAPSTAPQNVSAHLELAPFETASHSIAVPTRN